MAANPDLAEQFLALHRGEQPLLLPNAFDRGTARILAAMGFDAIATTSAGHAATLGRHDGDVSLDEALTHALDVVSASELPVSADFERGFADNPDDVAFNVDRAAQTGLAGLSIEDATGRAEDPIYDAKLAAERITAAAEVTRGAGTRLVLTARAENFIQGRPDLADTIARLQSFQEAGADVLYAPGLSSIDDIRSVVESVDLPVNVLALPGVPPVGELAEAGVRRISVGSAFSLVALSAVASAAQELKEQGTYGFWAQATAGRLLRDAFS